MPVRQWNMMNEYTKLNAGIGYTLEDVERHVDKIVMFVSHDMKKQAYTQRNNMHQCVWNCLRGLNYDYLQLIALATTYFHTETQAYDFVSLNLNQSTQKANKKLIEFGELAKSFDLALQNWDKAFILSYYKRFKQACKSFLKKNRSNYSQFKDVNKNALHDLRQGLINQLKVSFPDRFSNVTDFNYYAEMQKQVIHELKYIITGEESHKNASEKIEKYFVSLMNPEDFDGTSTQNVVIMQKKAFQEVCITMMTRGVEQPESLSVMAFYTAMDYLSHKQQTK